MIKSILANTVVRKTAGQTSIILRASGAGGDDIDDNLIELCGNCHVKAHNGAISKQELLKIVKRRKRK